MFISSQFRDSLASLAYGLAIRRPILFIGFIDETILHRIAALTPHRNFFDIKTNDFSERSEKLSQILFLFHNETIDLTASRVLFIAQNVPPRFFPTLFDLSYGWIASTLSQPRSLPEEIIGFNLKTKSWINIDANQLDSPYLNALLKGTRPLEWELILQTGLHIIGTKAQALIHLLVKGVETHRILRLLNISSISEFELCIAIAQADYHLDLKNFHQQANRYFSRWLQQSTGDNRFQL